MTRPTIDAAYIFYQMISNVWSGLDETTNELCANTVPGNRCDYFCQLRIPSSTCSLPLFNLISTNHRSSLICFDSCALPRQRILAHWESLSCHFITQIIQRRKIDNIGSNLVLYSSNTLSFVLFILVRPHTHSRSYLELFHLLISFVETTQIIFIHFRSFKCSLFLLNVDKQRAP